MTIELKAGTHFAKAAEHYDKAQKNLLAFGRELMLAIDLEGRTLREMSILKCGNAGLEDKFARYVQAARWQEAIKDHPAALDAEEWLTPSHYTELYREATINDTASALDLMEQCLVRNVTDKEVVEARPVDWLRTKRQREVPSLEERRHRFWMLATRFLSEMTSYLERQGKLVTEAEQQEYDLLIQVVKRFQAQPLERIL